MQAVVFQGAKEPLELTAVDRPTCGPDGAIVETIACGICRSDWHAWQGHWDWLGLVLSPGLILGHEPVGRVVEVGDRVTSVAEGDVVTNPFNLSDGTCYYCRSGRANLCDRTVPMGFVQFQQGAFAEAYAVRNADQNLIPVPDAFDPVDIAGLGCRFATAFHGLSKRVDVEPGDWVAVHGCGGVGLSAIHIAKALGGNVIAVDIEEEKLEWARDLGADETVNAAEVDDVPGAVTAMTESNRGVEVSVEAIGLAETIRKSIRSLAPGGQHLQVGLTTDAEAGDVAVPVDRMVQDEQEFHGSFGIPPHEYREIFRMMERGTLAPGRLVSETCSLSAVPSVLERLSTFDTVGIPVCTDF